MRKINFFKSFKLSKKYWALALGAVSILTIGTICTILSSCNEETNIEKAINKRVSEFTKKLCSSITQVKNNNYFNTNGQEDQIKKDEDSGIEFKEAILKEEYRSYANKRSEEGASNKQICKEIKELDLSMYDGLDSSYDYLKVFVERKMEEKKIEDCDGKPEPEIAEIEAKYNKVKTQQLEAIDLAESLGISVESKEFSQLFTSVYNMLTSESLNDADVHRDFIYTMETILLNNIEDKLDFSNLQNILMPSSTETAVYTSIKNYLDAYYDPSKMQQEMFCDATRSDNTIKTAISGLFSNINYVTLNDPEDPEAGSTSTPISYLADSVENPINMLLDSLDTVINVDSSWANHFQFGIKFVLNANEDWDSTKPFGFSNFDFDQDTWKATVKFDLYVDYSESGNFTGNSTGDHDEYEVMYGDDQEDNHEGNFESSYYLNIGDAITPAMKSYFGVDDTIPEEDRINVVPAFGYDNPLEYLTVQDFSSVFLDENGNIKAEYCDPNNLLIGTQLSPLISFIKGNEVHYPQLNEDIDTQDKNSYGALECNKSEEYNDAWMFTYDPNGIEGNCETSSNIIVKGNIASYDNQVVDGERQFTIHLNLWVSISAILNRSDVDGYNSNSDWYELPDSKSTITICDDQTTSETRRKLVSSFSQLEDYYNTFFNIFNEKTLSKMETLKGVMLANAVFNTAASVVALTYALVYTIDVICGLLQFAFALVLAWIVFAASVASAVLANIDYYGFVEKCREIDETNQQLCEWFEQYGEDFSDTKDGTYFDFTKSHDYFEFVDNIKKNIHGMKFMSETKTFFDGQEVDLIMKIAVLILCVKDFITSTLSCLGTMLIVAIALTVGSFVSKLITSAVLPFSAALATIGLSAWATPIVIVILATILVVNTAILTLHIVLWVLSPSIENKFEEWKNFCDKNNDDDNNNL